MPTSPTRSAPSSCDPGISQDDFVLAVRVVTDDTPRSTHQMACNTNNGCAATCASAA